MIGHRAFSAKFTLDALPKHVHSMGDILYSLALMREDDVSKSYDNCQEYIRKFPRDGQLSAAPELLAHLKEELQAYFTLNATQYGTAPGSADELAQSCIDRAILMTSPYAVIQKDSEGEIVFMGIAHGREAASRLEGQLQERIKGNPAWDQAAHTISVRIADDYISSEE